MPRLTLRAGRTDVSIVSTSGDVPVDARTAQTLRSVENVLLGLGQCTLATLRPFLERKGLPVEGLVLELSAELNEPENLYDRIRMDIRLSEAIPESLRPAIANVARSCRVHRTLSRALDIALDVCTAAT